MLVMLVIACMYTKTAEVAEIILQSLREAMNLTCDICKKHPQLSVALSRALTNAQNLVKYKFTLKRKVAILESDDWADLV